MNKKIYVSVLKGSTVTCKSWIDTELIYCTQNHELYFICYKFIDVYEFSVESIQIIF